jgi:hypothetical protein
LPTRGYVWAYYESDDGNTYALKVDADYAAAAERGWTAPAAPGTPIYPRGWIPRKVTGIDPSGQRREALVASVAADLWTSAATTFDITGTDETTYTCTVHKRLKERRSSRPR